MSSPGLPARVWPCGNRFAEPIELNRDDWQEVFRWELPDRGKPREYDQRIALNRKANRVLWLMVSTGLVDCQRHNFRELTPDGVRDMFRRWNQHPPAELDEFLGVKPTEVSDSAADGISVDRQGFNLHPNEKPLTFREAEVAWNWLASTTGADSITREEAGAQLGKTANDYLEKVRRRFNRQQQKLAERFPDEFGKITSAKAFAEFHQRHYMTTGSK